jgi:hypothetical protein
MKIFGIGLSRTGTTSLHLAFLRMGIPALHYPFELSQHWMRGSFNRNFHLDYDAYTDIPTSKYFRELHACHPNAKFILTTRDEDLWINSVKKYWQSKSSSTASTLQRDILRLAVYGCMNFDEKRFREVYRSHNSLVDEHFAKYPNSLLRLDITSGQGWGELAVFLNLPIVKDAPFPHLKAPTLGGLTAVNRKMMLENRQKILERISLLSQSSKLDSSGSSILHK